MAHPAIEIYPYQRRWLEDASRFQIGCFARQTGKTFITTLKIVMDCLETEARGGKARWVILSRGERQAREAMAEGVERHAHAFGIALDIMEGGRDGDGADIRAGDKFGQITHGALETRFPGGSRITALPANPDTARGFSANVFLDEFAFHADSRKIWQALFPVISAGHRLIVTSTPNGKSGKFYELMTGKDTRWSRHHVDIHAAVADGLPRDVEELKAGLGDHDAWAAEYELEWRDEASAWLPLDLIIACESAEAGQPSAPAKSGLLGKIRPGKGHFFIGNDIATRGDLWVAVVLERVGDVLWMREIATLSRASFAAQAAKLDELVARYGPVRIAMDQTGMGEAPVEAAKARHGRARVHGVIFTNAAKQELAIDAKQVFEDRRIRLPAGDAALRADLHKIKKVTGPTGIPRFVAERDGSGHADRAWALFLGINAAKGGPQLYEYRPIRPHEVRPQFASGSGIRQIEGVW